MAVPARRVISAAVGMLLAVSACSSPSGAEPTTTATPSTTAPPTTEASTTTSTTSTTTTTTTTTTTLSPRVAAPPPADTYRWNLDQTARISAPGQIDEIMTMAVDAAVVGASSDIRLEAGVIGFSFDLQIVAIGDESWVKEAGKPWRVNDGFWATDSDAELVDLPSAVASSSLAELRALYLGLSELSFERVDYRGVDARRYEVPDHLHVTALLAAGVLDNTDQSFVERTADLQVWLDVATDHLIGLEGSYAGSVELVTDSAGYSDDSLASVDVELSISEIDSPEISVVEPDVPDFDHPDGYLVLDEPQAGVQFLYPEDWLIIRDGLDELIPGIDVLVAIVSLETGSNINVIAEDASRLPGLTLEEYVDMSVESYRLVGVDADISARTRFEMADGTPAVKIVVDVRNQVAEPLTQIIWLSGTSGYILTVTEIVAEGEDLVANIIDSIELVPDTGVDS